MDVGNSKSGSPHLTQEIGNKQAETNRTMTTRAETKRISEKIDEMPKNRNAQKSTFNLSNKTTTKERKKQKYSTNSSVEEIVDKGKVCEQTNTEFIAIGKYSTVTSVEEQLEDGNDLTSSTTLIDITVTDLFQLWILT